MLKTKQEYAIRLMENTIERGINDYMQLVYFNFMFDVHPMHTELQSKKIMLKAKAKGIVLHDRFLTGRHING